MVLQVGQIFGTPVFRGNPTFRHRLHERRRLEYLRIGDVGVLTQPIGDIDPSKECGAGLLELKLATNLQRRYELSRYSWYNCLKLRMEPNFASLPERRLAELPR
jgi:hypothetical protein